MIGTELCMPSQRVLIALINGKKMRWAPLNFIMAAVKNAPCAKKVCLLEHRVFEKAKKKKLPCISIRKKAIEFTCFCTFGWESWLIQEQLTSPHSRNFFRLVDF